jgi:lactate permease
MQAPGGTIDLYDSRGNWYGHEGDILRYVFFYSIALAALVGIMVTLQAYVFPFTRLVIR